MGCTLSTVWVRCDAPAASLTCFCLLCASMAFLWVVACSCRLVGFLCPPCFPGRVVGLDMRPKVLKVLKSGCLIVCFCAFHFLQSVYKL